MTYILIAEDDRDVLLLTQRRLEMAGFTPIWTTADGEVALQQALQDPPRLMILDVILPSLDGLRVCAKVKEVLGDKAPPVIITSARGQDVDLQYGKMAGADAYIIKPFSPRELISRVQELLK